MLNQKRQRLRKQEAPTVVKTVVITLCSARCQKLIYRVLAAIEPHTPQRVRCPNRYAAKFLSCPFAAKAFCSISAVDYTADRASTINILSFSFTVTRTTAKCQAMV
jgi:hypothetical protein